MLHRKIAVALALAMLFPNGVSGRAAAPVPQLTFNLGHRGSITCLCFAPDGRTLASGSMDMTVKLWDFPKHNLRRTLIGRHSWALTAAFSHDGRRLAVGSVDGSVVIWDTATGKQLLEIAADDRRDSRSESITEVAFSPDDSTLASVDVGGFVRLVDARSGKLVRALPQERSGGARFAFTGDGHSIVTVAVRDPIQFWDIATGAVSRTIEWDKHSMYLSALSADGKMLVSQSFASHALTFLTLATGAKREGVARRGTIMYIAFSANDAVMVGDVFSAEGLVWDTGTGTLRGTIRGAGRAITAVAVSPDGKTFCAGDADSKIRVWNLQSHQREATLPGYNLEVNGVAFAHDGRTVAAAYSDGGIRIWDTATGRLRRTIANPGNGVSALSFSPDGSTLAAACNQSVFTSTMMSRGEHIGEVRLWDSVTWQLKRSFVPTGDGLDSILDIAFSPDGETIASCNYRGSISLWNVGTGAATGEVTGRQIVRPKQVRFSPDGKLLACATPNFTLFWKMPGAAAWLRPIARASTSLAFTPDGRTFAVGTDYGAVQLWEVESGKGPQNLSSHDGVVRAISISPDGADLASAGEDGLIRLDLLATGHPLRTLTGQLQDITSLSFAPDGKTIASGSKDGAVTLWRVADGRCLATMMTLPPATPGAAENWITYATDGSYVGTPGAVKSIEWRLGDRLIRGASYAARFNRPDLVEKSLAAGH